MCAKYKLLRNSSIFRNPPEPSAFPWLPRRVVTAWELAVENRMSTSHRWSGCWAQIWGGLDTKYLRLRYDHKRTRIKLPGSTKYLRLWYDQKWTRIKLPGWNMWELSWSRTDQSPHAKYASQNSTIDFLIHFVLRSPYPRPYRKESDHTCKFYHNLPYIYDLWCNCTLAL